MSFADAITPEHPRTGASISARVSRRQPPHLASSVLYFGTSHAVPASLFTAAKHASVVEPANCMWVQLTEQFDLVVIDGRTVEMNTPETRRAVLHAAVQHLAPGGQLIGAFALHDCHAELYEQMCAEFNLEPEGRQTDDSIHIAHRRTCQTTIHDLVFEARSRITRIAPASLHAALDSSHPPTVIDTRTNTDRERFGVIRGSIHIPRTTLEWACDPTNGYRHPAITSRDQSLVIVCNGGYSSSLAAANLALLGFAAVNDLIGGHQAWARAGHEVVPPDHTSLDY